MVRERTEPRGICLTFKRSGSHRAKQLVERGVAIQRPVASKWGRNQGSGKKVCAEVESSRDASDGGGGGGTL